jgi:hypothetical protein
MQQNSGSIAVMYRLKIGIFRNKVLNEGSQEVQLLRLVSSGNYLPAFAEK